MADSTLANLTAADDADDADLLYLVKGGADRKATVAQLRAGLVTNVVLANTLLDYTATEDLGDLALLDAASIAQVTGLQAALDAKAPSTNIALAALAALTASRALVSDPSGVVSVSPVTATELGHVAGVTSAIQTQINDAIAAIETASTADRARSNHTGTQTAATISDFATAADARVAAASIDALADVTITAGADGDFLRHNGTAWVDATIGASDLPTVPATKGGTGLTTIAADRLVGSTALDTIAAIAIGAGLQLSGGTLSATGGVSGLTANVIPVATGAAAIGNSKVVVSGTNGGTVTVYDDTASTGSTLLVVKGGAAQTSFSTLQEFQAAAGTPLGRFQLVSATAARMLMVKGSANAATYGIVDDSNFNTFRWYVEGFNARERFPSDGAIAFSSTTDASGSPDADIRRAAAGVLAIGDGAGTGLPAGLQAASFRAVTANGAVGAIRTISESITLSTSGATTDSAANLLPANAEILGVSYRITTAITGVDSTSIQVGDATTAARFGSGATFTANATGVLQAHRQGGVASDAAGPIQTAAAKLRLTMAGGADNTPAGGVVRVTVTYWDYTAPTS